MRYGVKIAPAAMAAALLLGGCEHKELCYRHPHGAEDLEVRYEWEKAPEAHPAVMTLYLYAEGGGDFLRFDFTDRTGGTVRVPSGRYRTLSLNGDAQALSLRGTETHAGFEITTPEAELLPGLEGLGIQSAGAPRAEGTGGERVAASPDTLWCDRSLALEVAAGGRNLLTHTPVRKVCYYTVEILGVRNLNYTTGVSATLSGLAGGYHPGSDAPSAERVTVPFELEAADDGTTLRGRFLTFGDNTSGEDGSVRHVLTVYAVLTDGSKWYHDYDVTEQLHAAADPWEVLLRVEGLSLPKPIVNGGGLQPTVDDWQDVAIDIEM